MIQVNKTKRLALLSLILLFFLSYVSANSGFCTLNRQDPFTPGEIGSLTCGCTSASEENRAGYIVWINDNGSIIFNSSVNSGACRTNVFSGAYVFTDNDIDINGTAIFSLNDDGTGIPIGWDDVSDVRNDSFSVANATATGCIISNVVIPVQIDLGINNANVFRVNNSLSGNPVAGITCRAIAYSADKSPILVEPYGEDSTFFTTGHDGIGVLKSRFAEERFKPNTTYQFQLICQCFNETGSICYDDTTGDRLGYQSCEVSATFTTAIDKRQGNFNVSYFVLGSLIFIVILFILAFLFKRSHIVVSIFLIFIAFFMFPVVGNLILKMTENTLYATSGFIFYKIMSRLPHLAVIYSFIYGLYAALKYFVGVDLAEKIKKKLKGVNR